MTDIPTLHDIAAMPLPASVEAMRKHYDPKWGTDVPEGKSVFRVKFDWSINGSFDEEVEAESEEEAREIAEEMAADDSYSGDFEVRSSVKITPVTP